MSERRRAPQREPVVDHVLTTRTEDLIPKTLPLPGRTSGNPSSGKAQRRRLAVRWSALFGILIVSVRVP